MNGLAIPVFDMDLWRCIYDLCTCTFSCAHINEHDIELKCRQAIVSTIFCRDNAHSCRGNHHLNAPAPIPAPADVIGILQNQKSPTNQWVARDNDSPGTRRRRRYPYKYSESLTSQAAVFARNSVALLDHAVTFSRLHHARKQVESQKLPGACTAEFSRGHGHGPDKQRPFSCSGRSRLSPVEVKCRVDLNLVTIVHTMTDLDSRRSSTCQM